MAAIISAENVAKIFRQRVRQPGVLGAFRDFVAPVSKPVKAVDGISFAIQPGEAVGYLGPNGAGKSTMIKMLTGILAPSSGTVTVLARHPQQERVANAREIGAVFGQRTQLCGSCRSLKVLNCTGACTGCRNRSSSAIARILST